MAGHSKWANIKHKKARTDASRGKIFTKFIREITVAARLGGPSEADNPRLRAIVSKALGANMTRDVVNRAISRGAGGDDDKKLDELTYEGYGVGGVAVLVETMTDNINRTVSEVRHGFSKNGGNLGTNGSVAYLFAKRGEIVFSAATHEDQLLEVALEAGADDVWCRGGCAGGRRIEARAGRSDHAGEHASRHHRAGAGRENSQDDRYARRPRRCAKRLHQRQF